MEESWRRKWKVVRKWNIIVLFSVSWHHSTLLQTHWAPVSLKSCPVWSIFVYVLTACVFVTRDTVCHPRRFVFGKFVRNANCSWSEAFVNRGLTVFLKYIINVCGFLRNRSQFWILIVIFVLSASKLIRNGYCYLRSITSVKICCPL